MQTLFTFIDKLHERRKHSLLYALGYVDSGLSVEKYLAKRNISHGAYNENLAKALQELELDCLKKQFDKNTFSSIRDIVINVEKSKMIFFGGHSLEHGKPREELVELLSQNPDLLKGFQGKILEVAEYAIQVKENRFLTSEEIAKLVNLNHDTVWKKVLRLLDILHDRKHFYTQNGELIRPNTVYEEILHQHPTSEQLAQLTQYEREVYEFMIAPLPYLEKFPVRHAPGEIYARFSKNTHNTLTHILKIFQMK